MTAYNDENRTDISFPPLTYGEYELVKLQPAYKTRICECCGSEIKECIGYEEAVLLRVNV